MAGKRLFPAERIAYSLTLMMSQLFVSNFRKVSIASLQLPQLGVGFMASNFMNAEYRTLG
jgi:hypothetical protein